jgi:hypothetical protein
MDAPPFSEEHQDAWFHQSGAYVQHSIIVKNPSSVPKAVQAVICSLRRLDLNTATKYAQGLVNGGYTAMLVPTLVRYITQHYALPAEQVARDAVCMLRETHESLDELRGYVSYVIACLCAHTPSRLGADLEELFTRGLPHVEGLINSFACMTAEEVLDTYRASFRTNVFSGPGLMPLIRELTARMAAGNFLLGHFDEIGVDASAAAVQSSVVRAKAVALLRCDGLVKLLQDDPSLSVTSLLTMDRVHMPDVLGPGDALGPYSPPELNIVAGVPDYAYNPGIAEGQMVARRIEAEAGAAQKFLAHHGVTMPATRAFLIGQAIRVLETDWFTAQVAYGPSRIIAQAVRVLRFAPMLENVDESHQAEVVGEWLQLCSTQILPGYLLKARLEVTGQTVKI